MPHFGKRTNAKNEKWIQNNICYKAYQHADHRFFHPADCLENFLIGNTNGDDRCKQKDQISIRQSEREHIGIGCVHGQKALHAKKP